MRHHSYYNGAKTAALLGGLSAITLLAGALGFGRTGLVVALVLALGLNAFSYFNSDKLALRSMRAFPASEVEQPRLYAIVRELAGRDRMPMPRICSPPTRPWLSGSPGWRSWPASACRRR
jgi:heat shock protein HtpX